MYWNVAVACDVVDGMPLAERASLMLIDMLVAHYSTEAHKVDKLPLYL